MVGSLRRGANLLVVLGLLCTVATAGFVGVGYLSFRTALRGMDTEPYPLPVPEISPEQERAITTIDTQIRALTLGGQAGDVVIPGDLFNAWLRLTSFRALRIIAERSWFTFGADTVTAELAVPLDSLGAPGRFFNGEVSFSGQLRDGSLRFTITDIRIRGKQPRGFTWARRILSSRDIAEAIGVDGLLSEEVVRRCSIYASLGQLYLTCKARSIAAG